MKNKSLKKQYKLIKQNKLKKKDRNKDSEYTMVVDMLDGTLCKSWKVWSENSW